MAKSSDKKELWTITVKKGLLIKIKWTIKVLERILYKGCIN